MANIVLAYIDMAFIVMVQACEAVGKAEAAELVVHSSDGSNGCLMLTHTEV